LNPIKPKALKQGDRLFLRLLHLAPFDRRPGGGWRFGTRKIGATVVARLIASGLATSDGVQVFLSTMLQ